ncbi:sensor histidine kinase [Foetidibacter luteolus]|uniref:sensor histidine kinase n=1 Tax=Foetidibacter luteolus TaxID=2608880 RepID=UPI001A999D82|nr:ATP-binding protein [Foetidibacter luteolus]
MSDSLYNALRKELRPADRNNISVEEVSHMLAENQNSFVIYYLAEFKNIVHQLEEKYPHLNSRDDKVAYAHVIVTFYVLANITAPQKYWYSQLIGNAKGVDSLKGLLINNYMNFAILYSQQNKPDSAMEILQNAVDITDTDTSLANLKFYVWLASVPIYRSLQLYPQAIDFANRCLSFYGNTNPGPDRVYLDLQLGKAGIFNLMYAAGKNPAFADSSETLVKKVMATPGIDSGFWFQQCYRMIAQLQYGKGNYKEAEKFYGIALQPRYAKEGCYGYSGLYKTNLYYNFSRIKQGISSGITAVLDIKVPPDDYFSLQELNRVLSEYYDSKGDYRNAYRYYKAYKNYFDSLNILGQRGRVFEAEQKYAVAQKEKQIVKLQNQSLHAKSTRNKLVMGGLVVVVLMGSALMLLYMRSKRQKLLRAAERQALSDELYAMEQQMEQERLLQRREREKAMTEQRKSISKDMHDEVSSSLAALRFFITDVKQRAADKETKALLLDIEEEATHVYEHSRNFMHKLNANANENYNVATLLSNLSFRFNKEASLQVVVNTDDYPVTNRFSPQQHAEMYRVIKEAVANSMKHSGSSIIYIKLHEIDKHCFFEIADNGKGITNQRHDEGIGLITISQRVALLQGEVSIGTGGTGTKITGRFPLEQ